MPTIARQDFESTKGETFTEIVGIDLTSGITDSCSPAMVIRTSPKGQDYLTLDGDDIQVVTVEDPIEQITYFNIQIHAGVLFDMPAYKYWYSLVFSCSTQKYVVLEGDFLLRESTILPCEIPLVDSMDDSVVCGVAPVVSDLNESLQAVYARQDPLFFQVLGTNPITNIVVERPHGEVIFRAFVRGRYVNDPGFAHQALKYRVELTRYGEAWKRRLPWERYGEYVGGSLEAGEIYKASDDPFSVTITATDNCMQTGAQTYSIDLTVVSTY